MSGPTRSNVMCVSAHPESHHCTKEHFVGFMSFLALMFASVGAVLCLVIPDSTGIVAVGALCVVWVVGFGLIYLREFL